MPPCTCGWISAAVEGFTSLEQPVEVRPGAGELNKFTSRGYTTAFAVLGLHRWHHTIEDTLERVDARLVARPEYVEGRI